MKTLQAARATVTTQMVLASALLRLSGAEVEQAIRRELAENPALELVETHAPRPRSAPGRVTGASPTVRWHNAEGSTSGFPHDEDFDPFEHIPSPQSPLEHLLSQARLSVPAAELGIVSYLIDALDGHGFLKRTEAELASELGISRERIAEAIAWLHQLEPPGIGARDLRECLLLQCAHLTALGADCSVVRAILAHAWDCFAEQRWDCVARKANVTRTEVDAALQFTRANLHPFPLSLVDDRRERTLTLARPDLIVRQEMRSNGAGFSVQVVAPEAYGLRINELYREAAATPAGLSSSLTRAERQWTCEAVERARHFMDALEGRRATLHRVAAHVVAFQEDFLEHGRAGLRPLTRSAVARALGLHESTVSRAVSDKVLQMPNGRLIEFSDLFDSSLAVKEHIRHLTRTSGRQLSDREIAAALQADALTVARRTVAKYRAQLGIPGKAVRLRPSGDD